MKKIIGLSKKKYAENFVELKFYFKFASELRNKADRADTRKY